MDKLNLFKEFKHVSIVDENGGSEVLYGATLQFFISDDMNKMQVDYDNGSSVSSNINSNWSLGYVDGYFYRLAIAKYNYNRDSFENLVVQFTDDMVIDEFKKAFAEVVYKNENVSEEIVEGAFEKSDIDEACDEHYDEVETQKDSVVGQEEEDNVKFSEFSTPRMCSYINPAHPGIGHHTFYVKSGVKSKDFVKFFDKHAKDVQRPHWRQCPSIERMPERHIPFDSKLDTVKYVVPTSLQARREINPENILKVHNGDVHAVETSLRSRDYMNEIM